ncbi:MAG: cardiolipin synthase [Patescibacteria group bacterium]|nr:cardiolipin synthase [Patescibacteria group bacterium]
MKYRLYTTSHKAWDGMYDAILKAEKSVYLEMYILLSNTKKTHDFFSLLIEKAKQGLEVVIIADSLGSTALSNSLIKESREAGIEFIFFSHFLKRTHRKMLIVDNKIAFLGGVNIKEGSRDWLDLQIKFQGKPVNLALRSFANAYLKVNGKKDSILKFSHITLPKKIKNWIFDNFPTNNKLYNLNKRYILKINQAKSLVQIVTPYLLPPRRLFLALDNACRRGVRVEIIIPKNTDINSLNKINYINARRLSDLGVLFYFGSQMNHSKILMIDKTEVLIGSQNADILSFGLNYEVGIFSQQQNLVKDVSTIIENWKIEATSFVGWNNKMKFFEKITFYFFRSIFSIF